MSDTENERNTEWTSYDIWQGRAGSKENVRREEECKSLPSASDEKAESSFPRLAVNVKLSDAVVAARQRIDGCRTFNLKFSQATPRFFSRLGSGKSYITGKRLKLQAALIRSLLEARKIGRCHYSAKSRRGYLGREIKHKKTSIFKNPRLSYNFSIPTLRH